MTDLRERAGSQGTVAVNTLGKGIDVAIEALLLWLGVLFAAMSRGCVWAADKWHNQDSGKVAANNISLKNPSQITQ